MLLGLGDPLTLPSPHRGEGLKTRVLRPVFVYLNKVEVLGYNYCKSVPCGNNSVVEYDLAKVGVEGSNPFSRSAMLPEKGFERSEVRYCD